MIDMENELFDMCVRAVQAKYPDIVATSQQLFAPSAFPSMYVVEADNYTDEDRIDSSGTERGSVVVYEATAYSNLRKGAKAQAKDIAQIIDGSMYENNFRRIGRTQGAMVSDPSVYQVTSRYTAGITDAGKLYRR